VLLNCLTLPLAKPKKTASIFFTFLIFLCLYFVYDFIINIYILPQHNRPHQRCFTFTMNTLTKVAALSHQQQVRLTLETTRWTISLRQQQLNCVCVLSSTSTVYTAAHSDRYSAYTAKTGRRFKTCCNGDRLTDGVFSRI